MEVLTYILHDFLHSFEINFQTGWTPESDIAFQFKPRINESVYLNSYRNGAWGCNESASIKPFQRETSFTMFVVITSDGFEVYVNGLFFCTFKDRLPLGNDCTLSIYGDVSVPFYGFIDNWSKSAFIADQTKITRKESQNLLPLPTEVSQPYIQPALPYVGSITGGLKPGMSLFLRGTVSTHAKGFEINFKTGPTDVDDIAFHFNPIIGQYVNLNSFRNGSWDEKEPTPAIPFTEGTALNMFVVITSVGYNVYVNGLMYCTFKHRIILEKVSTLAIRGDIFLPICGLIDDWKTSSFCSTSAPVNKDVSYQISNPILPYQTKIQGGLKPDMAILFNGTLPADSRRFEINLKTGFSDDDDIAFHFNPRIGQYVYLNSFRKGSWEKEQTAPDKPFTKGAAFKLLLVIKTDRYEVYVNDVLHCVFKHRIPLEEVTTLAILGDVSLLFCGFINNWKTSSFSSLILDSSPAPTVTELSFPVSNPTIPFVGKFKEGIKQDTALMFQAVVPKDGKNFAISLKTGPSDADNIAFHFNPCIGQDVYMNSFRNGKWETQETAPKNPFEKGITFKLFLVITVEAYEIYVNDFKLCTFKHRIPLEKVSTLNILGDVASLVCGRIENWSSSSIYKELKKVTTTTTTTTTTSTTITLQISKAIKDPAIPYVDTIPIAIKQNMAVLFQGIVSKNATRFEINFQTGKGANDDIAFHFNPRLGYYTALNTFRKGGWEKEESVPDKPFTKEAAFQIIVGFKSDEYEVYVNGTQHCTYKHRIPLEKVSTISIRGQVSIQMIGFIENWKSPSMSK
ncbi:uncharacterized protein LOC124395478 [Silurus meridionalis]|uniref:uncharacterized protein LOC124395478 n=1 Tax=Silurus meridionalis TaxID=175797 RepID=UPI001EEA28B2|nr:uncharacterized protein LOC124395478 [Silurus meridionalis]